MQLIIDIGEMYRRDNEHRKGWIITSPGEIKDFTEKMMSLPGMSHQFLLVLNTPHLTHLVYL